MIASPKILTCHPSGTLKTRGTLRTRHARKLLTEPNLPVCHHSTARSANWHAVLTCQFATPVRVASGTQARRAPDCAAEILPRKSSKTEAPTRRHWPIEGGAVGRAPTGPTRIGASEARKTQGHDA